MECLFGYVNNCQSYKAKLVELLLCALAVIL